MNIAKKLTALIIILLLQFSSVLPFVQRVKSVSAEESCSQTSSSSSPGSNLKSRVGGVALDQAAKFLADMTDITGAYYDQGLDRIVFVGKKNTTAPKFDKDDLAIAIKTVIFEKKIPRVSMELGPNSSDGLMYVSFEGNLEDTKFGKLMLDADYQLKIYGYGIKPDGTPTISNVPGYRSSIDRYFDKGFDIDYTGGRIRYWLTPELISIRKDDPNSAFVFETTKMQIRTEVENELNGPNRIAAAKEFAQHMTDNYDLYAAESPSWQDLKQLGRITAVVKWIYDSGINTDFNWARDYAPKREVTQRTINQFPQRQHSQDQGDYTYTQTIVGGANFETPNTPLPDTTGTSLALKTSSQAVPTTKEDIHWTFTKDNQQYEAVAVAADAFRSVGSYNTASEDMSFPVAGDLNLNFTRVYSSYSGGQYGVGRGWNIFPVTLYDNDPVHTFSCAAGLYPKALSFVSQSGGFESFTINDCNIGYVADDPAYHSKVSRNSDGTFTTRLKDQTEFNFDAQYKLKSIKDKNGNLVNYNYDSSNKLTSIADTKNHAITLSYNAQNWISEATDWSGRKVKYSYDDQGNLLTVTDPNGNITTYTYDTNFKLTSIKDGNNQTVITNTYTDEAKLATQKNAVNNTASYNYDKVNRIVIVADNQTPNRTQVTKYDAKARVLEQTDPLSFKLTYTYGTEYAPLTIKDKNGNIVTNTYDTNGNLATVIFPDTKKVTYQYDPNNRLTKIIDERYGTPGKDTTNTYDATGNLTQINQANQLTKFTYDTSGEALTLTDPLLHVTTWTRDSLGNKLTEKDGVNNITNFEYDLIGRLKKKTDPDTKITTLTYDNNGNVLTLNDGVGTTTNVYDKENGLTKVTLPDNTVSEFAYNPLGSLISTKDQALNTSNYGYDIYQNLKSQSDALAKISVNNFDPLNRQIQSTTPMGMSYKYEYDKNGNITKRFDANNAATSYQYDAFNRLIKITYPDTKTVTFTYDNRGNRTQMIDPVGTSTYVYDNFNRLTQATNAYGKVLKYTYDNANNLKTIVYPDSGGTVTYTYDNNNRLISVKDMSGKITTYTYNKNGTLATRLLPNTIKTTYTYDSANRTSSITHAKSTTTLAKFIYTRNSLGNITGIVESGSFISSTPKTTSFIYNPLGRITKATYPGNKIFEYTYDKMGNRLTQKVDNSTTTTYAFDNDYKLIQKNNLTSYTYDNNGNQTKKPSGNFNANPIYGFDFENRLITHTTSVGNAYDYKYDGLGNRLRKHMGTAVTRYIFDTSGPLSRLMATSGDQNYASTFWIYGLGIIKDGDNGYHLEDASGNMRFTTSSSGSKSTSANYDPFGNVITSSGLLPDFQFNEQQYDEHSNMYFLRARYYDPETGRFISRDPVKGGLANPQTQNPYAYSLNNPVNYSDPSGKTAGDPIDYEYPGYQNKIFFAPLIEMSVFGLTSACVGAYNAIKNFGSPPVLKGAQNPKVQEAIEYGKKMHLEQEYPLGFKKEDPFLNGLRPDAINTVTKQIIELKPNNPNAIRLGEKQLEKYINQANQEIEPGFTGQVWTYDR